MADQFIAGYKVSFTIADGSEISLAANQVALTYGAAQLPKPVFGSPAQRAISGQKTGTFTASGHGEVSAIPALNTLRDSADGEPVTITLTYGDGGSDEFDAIIGEIGHQAQADGQLEWSLGSTVTGEVTYTPPAGP